MKRIYISGPMTWIPESNFPAFNAEASRLRALGFEVCNPVDINPDPATPWHQCMRRDLQELLACDTLALLPGWQRSNGAHLEMHVAHRVGMEIVIAAEILQGPGRVCGNCDTALPTGCSGLFRDDGAVCALNQIAAA